MHKRVLTGALGSDLWSRCPHTDRSYRADVYAFAAVLASRHGFPVQPIKADHRVETSLGKIHKRPDLPCPAHANAPAAQNAAVGVISDEGMIFYDTRFLEDLFKPFRLEAHAEEFGDVLKSAFLVRLTVSAIYIMNREEQAKGASLQAPDGRGVGLDHHWSGYPNGTGGKGFSVDFNKTQSAGGIRMLHAFQITEVWDINAVAEAGFEQNSSLWDFNLFMIYQDFDHERSRLFRLIRTFDHRGQVRRGDPPDCTVLCRAGNHAFPAFDAQALVHGFLAISCREYGFHRTAPDASIAPTGALFKVNIVGGQGPAHS
jgi:hypothetical protein